MSEKRSSCSTLPCGPSRREGDNLNLFDLSFIQNGRQMEIDAIESGRRLLKDDSAALKPEDDIQETAERARVLDKYLPHAEAAFRERQLTYPFQRSTNRDSLAVIPGRGHFAGKCVELTELVGRSNAADTSAKRFEVRAVQALHRLIGGWAVCVGSPREDGTGAERAVTAFRRLLEAEKGDHWRAAYPAGGDFGADAFWILGRSWGGPVMYFQAKNTAFSLRNAPPEFLRISEVLREWFGRRIDQRRAVVPVYAVNTIFTRGLKERVFEAGGGKGYHVLDAADILYAEALPRNFKTTRDWLRVM
jgi:hypothetical protein